MRLFWTSNEFQLRLLEGGNASESMPVVEQQQFSTDALFIPCYVALLSFVLFAAQAIRRRHRGLRITLQTDPLTVNTSIFIWNFLRLLGCVTLLGLCIGAAVTQSSDYIPGLQAENGFWSPSSTSSSLTQLPLSQISLACVFIYASFLALLTLKASLHYATPHLVTVLLATWFIYVYMDLWPLATFTGSPVDVRDDPLLWARISILSFVAVLVPLGIPRPYVPVDPTKLQETPNLEQTSSILSLLLCNFLDPLIFMAYKSPNLPSETLPPLCDYDRTEYLIQNSFQKLDPHGKKRRTRMLWSLLALFWEEYAKMTMAITIKVGSSFLAPLTINRLLAYVESGGDGAVVKPWVWIILMFSGPVLGSISEQYYNFLSAGCMVRVEGILTQLIFHHSLRIRMVAKPDNADKLKSPDLTNDAQSLTGSQIDESDSDTAGVSHPSLASATDVSQASLASVYTPTAKFGHIVGRINNLITVDTQNILEGRNFLYLAWYAPLQLAICTWFLFVILSWSAIVGIVVLLICFPIQGYVARLVNDTQSERMKKTDARTENVTEVLNMLRMIKLFAWEEKTFSDMDVKREEELQWVKRLAILQLATGFVNCILSTLSLLATYAVYTAVMKEELTAARIFSSMTVFDLLRNQLHMVSFSLPGIVQAKVSLDRLDEFLGESELLDAYNSSMLSLDSKIKERSEMIGFCDACFVWSVSDRHNSTSFHLQVDGELLFPRGKVTLITGPTSCGKTSLLYALMGEMHLVESEGCWFNLPKGKGVAFVAQESWVQNDTIKNNILFGSPFDETRYRKVLFQCGLQQDLELWEAGDDTEVGERGLTLSGGQKARLTLARAVYSQAEILLLDDVLAALDVHTSKWIIEKCLNGDLIKGRTVVMITHNVGLASTAADYVVTMSVGGKVGSLQPTSQLQFDISASADDMEGEVGTGKVEPQGDKDSKRKADTGKLVVAEEVAQGHVGWAALSLYFTSLGGVMYWIAVVGGDILAHILGAVQPLYLGFWAKEYETKAPSEVAVWRYLTVYSVLLVICPLAWFLAFIVLWLGSVRASRKIYRSLSGAILGTTFRWLDTTPQSRIISRFTQDTRALDGPVPAQLGNIIGLTDFMMTRLIAVVFVTPVFIVTGLFVGLVGGWFSRVYLSAQLPIKRALSNARSPVVAHFGAAIAGTVSLRAYGAQDAVLKESMARIDEYTRISRTFHNLTRWISIRIDTLSAVFTSSLAAYLVYIQKNQDAGTIGFSINMAVSFSSAIIYLVQGFNDFEVEANSMERLKAYISIPQEPKSTESGMPPAHWPSSGNVDFDDVCVKYSEDGSNVLHNVSFSINSGEHIGVVGRTGSGKSTLALSILRCMITTGVIRFDGVDIAKVNLDILRSRVTIIPQAPELLAGTLRQNLDPFGEYDDLTLNDALNSVGWYSIQDDKAQLRLDSAVASGGSNLSVGQRQILALARAIVRGSKLLILDEATSAIDHTSDMLIQRAIRKELKGVTLIIVAHRLQTIMDADKILVLDSGKLVEYDTPMNLLQKKGGFFNALVGQSENKEELLRVMAQSTE